MSSYAGLIESLLVHHNSNFSQVRLSQIKNKSGYDSIVVSSDMTAYRPKISGAIICKVKDYGKQPYISFRNKYKHWFDEKEVTSWINKSDNNFFRISPLDFLRVINDYEEEFSYLAAQICVDAMSFPKFGCCSKYKQCSDAGKCIHDDLLYSSACEYRRNLEAGKNFYKTEH